LTRVCGVVGYFKPKGKEKPRRGCGLGSFKPYNHAPSRLLSIVPWNKCRYYTVIIICKFTSIVS